MSRDYSALQVVATPPVARNGVAPLMSPPTDAAATEPVFAEFLEPEDGSNRGFTVPITTLAPEPFDVLKTIIATVQPSDGEFTASFFDANVNTAGCNEQEAVENLKDLLISRFCFLSEQPADKLSRPLAKQIAVLREFIRRKC